MHETGGTRTGKAGWRLWVYVAVVVSCGLASCRAWRPGSLGKPAGQPTAAVANPLLISCQDREYFWRQLVDTLDDDFQILREEPVRVVGGVLTDGHIETVPRVGSTLLEPWRHDSTPGFEKLQSTFQSIRRRVVAHIQPRAGGYSVEMIVWKELEDLERPELAPVGGIDIRHDGALDNADRQVAGSQSASSQPAGSPLTLRWIPLGRDVSLEQQLLVELRARVGTR